ncbi:MAG: GerMN domain-containing protein [Treponema sp.]|nr:GerMN domain-containing protein [Treponema sp.]
MNSRIRDCLHFLHTYRKWLPLAFLAILVITALIEFAVLGLARRTFVFYADDGKTITVEERMLRGSARSPLHPPSREIAITRYVQEALLGPVSPDSLPLFPRETRLLSLLYRNGVVYVDFSKDAALPPIESASLDASAAGEVFTNLKTLHSGMKRNFPFVKESRFFIAGKAAYPGEFR